jgi:uncharacterized protein (DUF58 family)
MDVLAPRRTPAEPGPGAISLASLRALEVAIARRLEGMLAGDFRSAVAGVGSELERVRPYAPGDDVRRMDWNVTARTGEPHVRIELAERVLTTWVVLDLSASMAFGTADRRKADVAEGVSVALGHVATRRGNRIGAVVFGGGPPRFVSPREGRRGLLLALVTMRGSPAGPGRIADALALVAGLATRRSLVVVVSDFRGPPDWRPELQRVAARHRTLAVEIRDPREQQLVDAGELRLEDPETGRQLLLDTGDPAVRERYALAATEERRALVGLLRSTGVPHVALTTEGDWLRSLAVFLARSERR